VTRVLEFRPSGGKILKQNGVHRRSEIFKNNAKKWSFGVNSLILEAIFIFFAKLS
jgi:hypothetical protein